ncbi:uncharacterized protein LOC131070385 [Cryptomeria japonica]|uniref:uncharacterized protein LOC131070385 n=1 Tax=Cryptomeria japonica TaxID=3369 RepID=UPI0027DA9FD9|nr:uncharacterized protein LOC131070385 [Cryptomeria japonica]
MRGDEGEGGRDGGLVVAIMTVGGDEEGEEEGEEDVDIGGDTSSSSEDEDDSSLGSSSNDEGDDDDYDMLEPEDVLAIEPQDAIHIEDDTEEETTRDNILETDIEDAPKKSKEPLIEESIYKDNIQGEDLSQLNVEIEETKRDAEANKPVEIAIETMDMNVLTKESEEALHYMIGGGDTYDEKRHEPPHIPKEHQEEEITKDGNEEVLKEHHEKQDDKPLKEQE